ncbi:hypothetical protein VNO77_39118 [Canavalia gladiata]|uniref:Uncharacterized protein n=1 Tax=Canavalia gladiata TaxID=3824 RepID=A0AAN9KC05_CANGL
MLSNLPPNTITNPFGKDFTILSQSTGREIRGLAGDGDAKVPKRRRFVISDWLLRLRLAYRATLGGAKVRRITAPTVDGSDALCRGKKRKSENLSSEKLRSLHAADFTSILHPEIFSATLRSCILTIHLISHGKHLHPLESHARRMAAMPCTRSMRRQYQEGTGVELMFEPCDAASIHARPVAKQDYKGLLRRIELTDPGKSKGRRKWPCNRSRGLSQGSPIMLS